MAEFERLVDEYLEVDAPVIRFLGALYDRCDEPPSLGFVNVYHHLLRAFLFGGCIYFAMGVASRTALPILGFERRSDGSLLHAVAADFKAGLAYDITGVRPLSDCLNVFRRVCDEPIRIRRVSFVDCPPDVTSGDLDRLVSPLDWIPGHAPLCAQTSRVWLARSMSLCRAIHLEVHGCEIDLLSD